MSNPKLLLFLSFDLSAHVAGSGEDLDFLGAGFLGTWGVLGSVSAAVRFLFGGCIIVVDGVCDTGRTAFRAEVLVRAILSRLIVSVLLFGHVFV